MIENIAKSWVAAKAAENTAIAARKQIEAEILKLLPQKLEGTSTQDIGGLKITASYKLTRTLDVESIKNRWNDLPEIVRDSIIWEPTLSIKNYRALEIANLPAFTTLNAFIATKSAATSLKITEDKNHD